MKYTDPDGEFVITAFLIVAGASMLIDYGIQVGMNYAQGYKGKDAWVNKVDFFDVAISGAIGGLTAGYGASLKLGGSVGKFGMFMVNNAKLVKAGEVVLTSAVDITGEGWQDVSFNQIGQRAVTGLATMAATDLISKQFKNKPKLGIEQKANLVDDAANEARSWLGNDYEVIKNKAGDDIFISKDGLRKIRFEIKNPGGDAPHIHLEIFKRGKWRDAIPGTHRLYPKP